MKKRNIGEELIEGLKQALDHSEGKITLRTTRVEIPDAPPKITKKDVAHIRNDKLHMSQGMFANLLGVSPTVVQSWEQGKKKPSGAARRLLQVASLDPEVLLKASKLKKYG
jgi:putative transcriptional regulator